MYGGGGGPSRPPGIVHPQEKAETIAKEIAKAAEAARQEHARQEQRRLEFMQEVARQQEYARHQELRRQEEQELRRQEEHKRRQEEKRQEELRQEEHKRRQEEERQKARQAAKQAELAKAKEQLRAQEKSLMAAKLAEATRVAEAARLAKQKEEAAKQAAQARLKAKEAKAAKAKAAAEAKAKAAAIREAKAKIAEAEAAAAARPGAKRKAEFPEPPFENGGASVPSVAAAASAIDEENEVWTKQADIECTEIINVTEDSPEHVWTRMLAEVKAATFVAVDTEFSGIGSMRTTRDKDMEVRYTAMRSAVQSHGLLQLGLSIWRRIDRETTGSAAYDTARYFVTSYCIPVLPSEDFSVTPSSLQFLAEAGIDLSQLCRDGVRFKKPVRAVRGAANANASSPMGERYLRELMAVCYTRPFVTHNGLLDLMFLYEAFTGPLPKKLGQFIAEGIKLYRGQLLDTKCIAEYCQRPAWSPSYLELLYARARRLCTAAAAETPVQAHLKFLAKAKKSSTNTPKGSHRDDSSGNSPRKPNEANSTLAASVADVADNSESDGSAKRRRLSDDDQDSTPAAAAQQSCQVCANYARHGNCPDGARCAFSHDIDRVLDEADPMQDAPEMLSLEQLKATQNAAAASSGSPRSADAQVLSAGVDAQETNAMGEGMHSAGYDARCTGYLLAYQALSAALSQKSVTNGLFPSEDGLGWLKRKFGNSLYLTGKDFPLQVIKTQFSGR